VPCEKAESPLTNLYEQTAMGFDVPGWEGYGIDTGKRMHAAFGSKYGIMRVRGDHTADFFDVAVRLHEAEEATEVVDPWELETYMCGSWTLSSAASYIDLAIGYFDWGYHAYYVLKQRQESQSQREEE